MTAPAVPAGQRPHPVVYDVDYPERLSRGLIFVKWLLAFPHYLILSALGMLAAVLAFFAWFAILFTGRYPKGIFELAVGYMRWSANVGAYTGLLRDEYPPFSWDAGAFPLILDVPRAERQSRFRLFIRGFALIPNYIVFYFVQIAGSVVSVIAWFAILLTGRYPRGLFRFSVGVQRWQQRQLAYALLLRDEFPPYSISAQARPGNEVVSAIIGVPLALVLGVLYLALFLLPIIRVDTVTVSSAALSNPGQLATERPTGDAGSLEIALVGYDGDATVPADARRVLRPADETLTELIRFEVEVEQDGRLPAVYSPYFFSLDTCTGRSAGAGQITAVASTEFRLFVNGGSARAVVYFWVQPGADPCSLTYFNPWGGRVKFKFE